MVDATQPGALRKVDTTHVPLSHYLGAVGMPGVTAWYGLVKIIAPKEGETLVVSAASGAVGSAFGALDFVLKANNPPEETMAKQQDDRLAKLLQKIKNFFMK